MTLITCSSYSAEVYRLLDTFRQYNPNDKIIWILADKQPLSKSDEGLIKEYFGNMEIVYHYVNMYFWHYELIKYQPQWTIIAQVALNISDDDIVLRCDAFDVLLQHKFDCGYIDNNVILCGTETMAYKDNVGAICWWDETKKMIYGDDIVMNSGVVAAFGKTFKKMAVEMAYGNYPGVYSDQALLHIIGKTKGIKLQPHKDILSIWGNKTRIDNKGINCNGIHPAIVHFSGASTNRPIQEYMQKTYPSSKCLAIEKEILGKNL